MNYQSFNGPSASDSIGKLDAIRLPELKGKSFLDIGCNEGFFCGAANMAGAVRVVGIDYESEAISRAKSHFPSVEFVNCSWDDFLDNSNEKFDVILFSSAIHYADDQEKTLARILNILTDDGVLVLECGIGDSNDSSINFVVHERWDGPKQYFTRDHLLSVVRNLNFDLFYDGDSVKQMGDAIERRVFHIRRRIQSFIFNFDPPGNGKSAMGALLATAGECKRLDTLASRIIKEHADSPLVVGAERNIAKLWTRAVDLAMHDWAAQKIFEFITPSKSELTYVEGWLPEQIIGQLDVLFAETSFVTFNMSRRGGHLPPKGNSPVAATLIGQETWFTVPITDAAVDYALAVTSGEVFILSAVGWHDASVPHHEYALVVGGQNFTGELLHRPKRGDLGPERIAFVVSFKLPISLGLTLREEANARLYTVGCHRALFELPAKQALHDVRFL